MVFRNSKQRSLDRNNRQVSQLGECWVSIGEMLGRIFGRGALEQAVTNQVCICIRWPMECCGKMHKSWDVKDRNLSAKGGLDLHHSQYLLTTCNCHTQTSMLCTVKIVEELDRPGIEVQNFASISFKDSFWYRDTIVCSLNLVLNWKHETEPCLAELLLPLAACLTGITSALWDFRIYFLVDIHNPIQTSESTVL
jgi:hypothetical protein